MLVYFSGIALGIQLYDCVKNQSYISSCSIHNTCKYSEVHWSAAVVSCRNTSKSLQSRKGMKVAIKVHVISFSERQRNLRKSQGCSFLLSLLRVAH